MTAALDMPAVDPGRVRDESAAPSRAARGTARATTTYASLSKQVQALGLLGRRRGFYWTRIATGLLAFAGVWVLFSVVGNSWYQLLVAAGLAVVLHQFAFLGHDGAHRQIFASARWNEWSGRVFAGLFAGLSYSWWTSKHSKHHGSPNQVGKDTDIESKVLAFHEDAVDGTRGFRRFFTKRQGWFFFPLLPFEGLNLHVDSFRKVLQRAPVKRRWVDLTFVSLRVFGYLGVLLAVLPAGKAAAFVGVQLGVFGLLMGGSFAPNHTGMPILPRTAKIDFLQRQVMTSRNISGGWVIDLFMGGLNSQIEHHLFPSMPRPNLRAARPLVRQFCADHGIPYTETTLGQSFVEIVGYLNEMGLRARNPFLCPLKQSLQG